MRGILKLIIVSILAVAVQVLGEEKPLTKEQQSELVMLQKDSDVAQAQIEKWTAIRDSHQRTIFLRVELHRAKLGLDDSWEFNGGRLAFIKKQDLNQDLKKDKKQNIDK